VLRHDSHLKRLKKESVVPKRVHCPYCDRLFSKDTIDDHIRKCRERNSRTRNQRRQVSRQVIVDGTNVAHYLSATARPRARNILLARQSLLSTGHSPVIVVSAALKHRIDNPELLMDMIAAGYVIEAKPGQNDDLVIIRMAQRTGADIITNDRFLDWLNRFPWLGGRLKRYRMTPSGLILE